jgi:hypothetical protein
MSEVSSSDDADGVAQGRQEVAALRAQLAARDDALARLTARLLDIERGQPGGEADRCAAAAEARADELAAELASLRGSRTFRGAAAARRVSSRIREPRPRPPGG